MTPRDNFERCAREWQEHIDAHSFTANPYVYIEHASFENIVAMGKEAIPLILEAYSEGHLFWGAALVRITGKNDFGNGVTGNLGAQKTNWLNWAKEVEI